MSLGQFGRRPAAPQRLQRDYRPCGHRRIQATPEDTESTVDVAEAQRSRYASAHVCLLHNKRITEKKRRSHRCLNF